MTYRVGVTAPFFNINKTLSDRFKKYVKSSIGSDDITLLIYLPSLESECITSGNFNRSKAINSGVKELISSGCDVIVATDLDMIVPPGLISFSVTKAIQTSKNILCMTRFVDISYFQKVYPDWKQFLRLPVAHSGFGGWNCLTSEMWKESGGYPEELTGWGYEDICFREKLQYRSIDAITVYTYPLLHINHPPRAKDQKSTQRSNVRIANTNDVLNTHWI